MHLLQAGVDISLIAGIPARLRSLVDELGIVGGRA